MTPQDFPESNADYGPPEDLTEGQCRRVPAYNGQAVGGSVDGAKLVIVAWKPDDQEIARIICGHPIYLTMLGGLAPHFLTTSFEQAKTPA